MSLSLSVILQLVPHFFASTMKVEDKYWEDIEQRSENEFLKIQI
jgi:hypothetical protein